MDVRFVEVKVSTDELLTCVLHLYDMLLHKLYCMYNTVVSGERTWSSNWRCFFCIFICVQRCKKVASFPGSLPLCAQLLRVTFEPVQTRNNCVRGGGEPGNEGSKKAHLQYLCTCPLTF